MTAAPKEAIAFAEAEVEQALEVREFVTSIAVIENDGRFEEVAKSTADIKSHHRELEAKRKEWTGPLTKVIRSINSAFKPALDSLKASEVDLKKKMATYVELKEVEQAALLDKVEATLAEGNIEEAREIVASAEEQLAPELSGVGMRTTWTGEVSDISLIPRKYLLVDVKALEAITRAAGQDPEIPGWRAFTKKIVSIGKAVGK